MTYLTRDFDSALQTLINANLHDGSSLRDLYVRNSELSIKAQTTFRF